MYIYIYIYVYEYIYIYVYMYACMYVCIYIYIFTYTYTYTYTYTHTYTYTIYVHAWTVLSALLQAVANGSTVGCFSKPPGSGTGRPTWNPTGPWGELGVSENSVPLNPMDNDHYPY